jgi:hypothetical protein
VGGRDRIRCSTRGRATGRDTRWTPIEQLVTQQAGIPVTALRVQDPELGMPAGRTVPAPGHGHRAALPDHVPAEADPAGLPQLEPEPARLVQRVPETGPDRGRLHHQQQRAGPACQRRQPARTISHAHAGERRIPTLRQIHHQHVHGSGGEQRGRQGQGFLEVCRGEHHEPLQENATGHRLDRVEGPGEIQPGDDRTRRLRLGDRAQRHGGLARRGIAPESDCARAREPTGSEQGVQRSKPGGHDPAIRDRGAIVGTGGLERADGLDRARRPVRIRIEGQCDARERPFDHQLTAPSWSCLTPSGLELRQRFGNVG